MPIENLHLRVGQSHRLTLDSRGSAGLQLKFRVIPEGICTIARDAQPPAVDTRPGDPIKVTFTIVAIQIGSARIVFYETQSWNVNFKDLIAREIDLIVTE